MSQYEISQIESIEYNNSDECNTYSIKIYGTGSTNQINITGKQLEQIKDMLRNNIPITH